MTGTPHSPTGYISCPARVEKRLSLTPSGNVRYHFRTPWRDGTTHVVFEPLDFVARLVEIVSKPRVNLTRFHGVFAPNSRYRASIGARLTQELLENGALVLQQLEQVEGDQHAAGAIPIGVRDRVETAEM